MATGYTVTNPPQNFQDVFNELRKIQESMQQPASFLSLDTIYAAPTKPREGMIVKADGSSFNPGSGAGAYLYRAGAWRFLG